MALVPLTCITCEYLDSNFKLFLRAGAVQGSGTTGVRGMRVVKKGQKRIQTKSIKC